MDMSEILNKIRTLSETTLDECNMTAEGEMCPVHGMSECYETTTMEESPTSGITPELAALMKKYGVDTENTVDEMFYYDKDSGDDQGHDELKRREDYATRSGRPFATLVGKKEYKDKDKFGDYYKIRGPKGPLPEADEDMEEGNEFSGALAAAKAAGQDTFEVGSKTFHVKEHDQYDEGVHVDIDGHEAEQFLTRLASLAGSISPGTEICPGCGHPVDQCACEHVDTHDMRDHGQDTCMECGYPMEECCCETITNETADYDHGHVEHSSAGEEVDPDEYMWKATSLPQRIVKGTLGDNPLIKEDVGSLFEKLSQDYEDFLMEADLEHSNVGNESPLSATDRDTFDKDPLADEEPVTDGSRSPLSRIERQHVEK